MTSATHAPGRSWPSGGPTQEATGLIYAVDAHRKNAHREKIRTSRRGASSSGYASPPDGTRPSVAPPSDDGRPGSVVLVPGRQRSVVAGRGPGSARTSPPTAPRLRRHQGSRSSSHSSSSVARGRTSRRCQRRAKTDPLAAGGLHVRGSVFSCRRQARAPDGGRTRATARVTASRRPCRRRHARGRQFEIVSGNRYLGPACRAFSTHSPASTNHFN